MKIVLVYNKKSGSSRHLHELRALFKKYGITISTAILLDDSLHKNLEPYVKSGEIIAAIGGDGTISAVAGVLAGTKATLAPLPGGTLNHFTKDLRVSQNIEEAIERLAHSQVKLIDVGAINDIVFINNSSLGLYPSSLRERDRLEDVLGKWAAAVLASFRELLRFKTYHVTIGDESFYTPFVFVGNNIYNIDRPGSAARDHLNEGILSVFIARTASRAVLCKIALLTLIGKSTQLDEFEVRKVSRLTISTNHKKMHVSKDGEMLHCSAPLRYESRPKSLRVRV